LFPAPPTAACEKALLAGLPGLDRPVLRAGADAAIARAGRR
jgi:hypothetical protein